jgi:threonine dehydratase
MSVEAPTLAAVRALRDDLASLIYRTPVLRCAAIEDALGGGTRVSAKLEFLQRTGTFKARGALAVLRSLSAEQLSAGVTAVSAGNHAIATAYAARAMGTTAKVVMIRSANPARIEACRSFGAEVVLADDVHSAFDVAATIEHDEGRFLVHPFEGEAVATGTGTLGLEICEQCEAFDALVVPVGGGGLIGGIANTVRKLRPQAAIYGVEPIGADSMTRSLAAGRPEAIDRVRSIADSLGAPFALPYSFGLVRANVDRIVLVDDAELRLTMGFLFAAMHMAVEPACAATTAALLGPLRDELLGRHVVLLFCGSNIDWATYANLVQFGYKNALR